MITKKHLPSSHLLDSAKALLEKYDSDTLASGPLGEFFEFLREVKDGAFDNTSDPDTLQALERELLKYERLKFEFRIPGNVSHGN